jgi:branched-chain amino acid transport system permease protein
MTAPGVVSRRLGGATQPAATVAVIAVIIFGLPKVLSSFELYTAIFAAIYLIAALGLNILSGYGGVISVGTAAFAMVGAYTVGIAKIHLHLNFVLGAALAIVVCAAVGLISALPVVRLGSFAVAVVTFAYLTAAGDVTQLFPGVTGGYAGLPVQPASLSMQDLWFAIAGLAAVCWILHRNFLLSPFGRALSATRLSPILATSLGVSPSMTKVAAFALSAGMAGLAGAMYPVVNGATASGNFTLSLSILILLMVIVGGEGTILGPAVGVTIFTVITYLLTQSNGGQGGNWVQLLYGGILLGMVLLVPEGVVGGIRRLARTRNLLSPKRRGIPTGGAVSAAEPTPSKPLSTIREALRETIGGSDITPGVLQVTEMFVSMGGVRAVDGASITVMPGTVHGLIGGNGSGKTTMLNGISGFVVARQGQVSLGSAGLPRRAASRARRGIGRTFQQPVLLASKTALENVIVGVDRHRHASLLSYLLRLPAARRESRASTREGARWLDALGLSFYADTPAGELPPGKQRLLEVCRALATRPEVLMLDEPAAGLNEAEIAELEPALMAVREAGISVLFVDHHVDLIMRTCDEISVLANGAVIAHGTPSEIRENPAVIESYLGGGYLVSREPKL